MFFVRLVRAKLTHFLKFEKNLAIQNLFNERLIHGEAHPFKLLFGSVKMTVDFYLLSLHLIFF